MLLPRPSAARPTASDRSTTTTIVRRAALSLRTQAATLGGTLAAFWIVLGINAALGGTLLAFGVFPRTTVGLRGILFAPFLHGSVDHLVANTVPFLILGWLVMLRDARHFLPVTACAAIGAGLMAWTFGAANSVHIGASGLIFGYLGFLMLAGIFTRDFWSILLGVGVTVVWGGLVYGVLPSQQGVSWQAHLGGFLGGIVAARWFQRPRR